MVIAKRIATASPEYRFIVSPLPPSFEDKSLFSRQERSKAYAVGPALVLLCKLLIVNTLEKMEPLFPRLGTDDWWWFSATVVDFGLLWPEERGGRPDGQAALNRMDLAIR